MIVPMKHLDLLCIAAEKDATLEQLRALGAVHLDLASAQGAAVAAAKGEIADAEKQYRVGMFRFHLDELLHHRSQYYIFSHCNDLLREAFF